MFYLRALDTMSLTGRWRKSSRLGNSIGIGLAVAAIFMAGALVGRLTVGGAAQNSKGAIRPRWSGSDDGGKGLGMALPEEPLPAVSDSDADDEQSEPLDVAEPIVEETEAASNPRADATVPEPAPAAEPRPIDPPGVVAAPSSRYDAELDYDFANTAIVTMATGNDAARMAIALVSSLRESKTRVQDVVVMLVRGGIGSPECLGEDGGQWKLKSGRTDVQCSGPNTVAEEIISPHLIETLRDKLGAVIMVLDMIPSTKWTADIPGGREMVRTLGTAVLVYNVCKSTACTPLPC